MIGFDVRLDREPAFPELAERLAAGQVYHLGNGSMIGLAALAGGMTSGRTSVVLKIELPDGRAVLAETSLALFLQAADMLRAKYGGL